VRAAPTTAYGTPQPRCTWHGFQAPRVSGGAAFGILTTGYETVCGILTNFTAMCWGENNYGQRNVPAISGGWSMLTAGYAHTCGIVRSNSKALCWGCGSHGGYSAAFGQCLVPDVSDGWSSLSAGAFHTCGITKTNSTLHCWGKKERKDQITVPAVSGGWDFVYAGQWATCGILKRDSSALCWGNTEWGQDEVPPLERWASLSSLTTLSCGITKDGWLSCWSNARDETGNRVPYVAGGWTSVSTSQTSACGITKVDSVLLCWGKWHGVGELLGRADIVPHVAGGFASVSCSSQYCCAIVKADSSVRCWVPSVAARPYITAIIVPSP
jgi:hypothetical protein